MHIPQPLVSQLTARSRDKLGGTCPTRPFQQSCSKARRLPRQNKPPAQIKLAPLNLRLPPALPDRALTSLLSEPLSHRAEVNAPRSGSGGRLGCTDNVCVLISTELHLLTRELPPAPSPAPISHLPSSKMSHTCPPYLCDVDEGGGAVVLPHTSSSSQPQGGQSSRERARHQRAASDSSKFKILFQTEW